MICICLASCCAKNDASGSAQSNMKTKGHVFQHQHAMTFYIRASNAQQHITHPRKLTLLERVKRQLAGGGDIDKPQIQTLSVSSKIATRFSQTSITSTMYNPPGADKEAIFKVRIPNTAFMSNFTMRIGDELFVAEVQSKEDAEKEYEAAQERNETAGLVSSDTEYIPPDELRGMDPFKVT